MSNDNLIRIFTKTNENRDKKEEPVKEAEQVLPFCIFQRIPEGEKGIPIFTKMSEAEDDSNCTNANNVFSTNDATSSTIPISADVKQALEVIKTLQPEDDGYGNFTLRLLRRIREIEKGSDYDITRIFYEFQIRLKNGEQYTPKIPGTQVHNLNWISEYTGGAAYISYSQNARKEVSQMIRAMIDLNNYLHTTIYKQNGWQLINGHWKYVIDSGIIGEVETEILGDAKHPFYFSSKNVGKINVFQEALGMKRICSDLCITTPLLLFTHCGALCKLFELANVPIKFVMAVIGATNSRKTSMALCMTKTFCRNNIFKPEVSFDSTQGGIEVESSKHADSVLIIDDYHPAISKREQNRLAQLLEFVLRRYGDRITKKRMPDFSPNKAMGTYDVEGVCVITGEDITGVQSSLTRTLVLEVNKESINNEILSYYQENLLILNTHMYDFIDYITRHFDELVSYIRTRVMKIRETANFEIPRFCEYFAQLSAVAEIIAKYATERGFWNENNALRWLQECTQVLDLVIKKNIVAIVQEDFASYVIQALKGSLVEYGVCNIEELQPRRLSREGIAEDNNYFYIQVDFLMELTRKYWLRLSKDLPFSSKKQLTMFLEQKGLILVRKEGDDIRRTLPIPKGKQRVLYIKKDKMTELLEKAEL